MQDKNHLLASFVHSPLLQIDKFELMLGSIHDKW